MNNHPQSAPMFAEWRWALRQSLFVLVLVNAPYLLAAWAAQEGWHFAGLLVNPPDGHTYLAKMRQGYAGHWLLHFTYTPEQHQPVLIYTFYLALGHLAAWTHIPIVLVFHLARLGAGLSLLLVLFRFICHVLSSFSERRFAFLLLILGSGFGWLFIGFDILLIDLWVPEALIPYTLYTHPHFPFATVLMLIIFQRVLWPPHRQWAFLGTGAASLILVMTQPHTLLIVWSTLGLYILWTVCQQKGFPWPQLQHFGAVILFAVPILAYDYWLIQTHPIISSWNSQNINQSPSLPQVLLGYGLISLFAILGIWALLRSNLKQLTKGEIFILGWTIAMLVAMYIPFNQQRRFIHGLHIPLVLLALIGLRYCIAHSPALHQRKQFLTNLLFGLGALGTFFVWSQPVIVALQSPDQFEIAQMLFIRHEERLAFEWLEQHASAEDVVLAAGRLGQLIPSQTQSRTFYGHIYETIDAETKKILVERFYRGDIEKLNPPVNFILYGPDERRFGQPAILKTYPLVFEEGQLQIYQVSARRNVK